MKRSLLSILVLIAVFFCFNLVIYAEDKIIEAPYIKVNINNKIETYDNVPIIVAGRSLLPLRAILTNLGVQNDDLHIVWNGTESSVTVYKDALRIYLKVGSKLSYINDEEVELDAAPVNYKGRIYIPARFIAQSLGKKVSWEPGLKEVLIRDIEGFNAVKDILEKSETVMNQVYKYTASQSTVLKVSKEKMNFSVVTDISAKVDIKNKLVYAKMNRTQATPDNALKFNMEVLSNNGLVYIKDSKSGKWVQNKIISDTQFNENFVQVSLEPDDINCSGFYISEDGVDEIILKGAVSLDDCLSEYLAMEDINQYLLDTAEAMLTINKATNLIKSINLKVSGSTTSITGGAHFTTEMLLKYDDINGSFEVPKP